MNRHIGAIDSTYDGSMFATHDRVTGTEAEIFVTGMLRSVRGDEPVYTEGELIRLAEITAEEAIVFAGAVEAARAS